MGSKTRPKESLLRRIMRKNEVGTLLPLLIMCAIIGIVNKDFFAFTNLVDVLRSTSYSFIIAAPLTCLMIAGGTDLTIGAVTSLGGVVCAWFMLAGIPIWLSILLTMVVGGLFGVLKALIVVKGGLHPFIVTLGLQSVSYTHLDVYKRQLVLLRRFKWDPVLVMVLCGVCEVAWQLVTGALV